MNRGDLELNLTQPSESVCFLHTGRHCTVAELLFVELGKPLRRGGLQAQSRLPAEKQARGWMVPTHPGPTGLNHLISDSSFHPSSETTEDILTD